MFAIIPDYYGDPPAEEQDAASGGWPYEPEWERDDEAAL